MRSEPDRLPGISLERSNLSLRKVEITPYERTSPPNRYEISHEYVNFELIRACVW